ncbi:MAG: tetratricopeptide repeat protein [bacterium]
MRFLLGIASASFLLLLVGCSFLSETITVSEAEERALSLYLEGERQLRAGRYSSAIGKFSDVVCLYYMTDIADDAQYQIGVAKEESLRAAPVSDRGEILLPGEREELSSGGFLPPVDGALLRGWLEVIQEFESVASRFPGGDAAALALKHIGDIYDRELGDGARALAYYRRVLNDYPDSPVAADVQYEIGEVHLRMLNLSEAKAAYRRVSLDYPDREDLSSKAKDRINTIDAYKDFDGAVLKLFIKGSEEYRRGEYFRAADTFRSLVSRFPDEKYKDIVEVAAFRIPEAYYLAGDFQRALEAFRDFLRKYPESKNTSKAREIIGDIYYFHRRAYERAILEYGESGALKRGRAHYALGEYEKALPLLEQAAKSYRDELAEAHEKLRREKIIIDGPLGNQPGPKRERRLEDYRKAKADYRLKSRLYGETEFYRGRTLQELGRYRRAIDALQSALHYVSSESLREDLLLSLGEAYYSLRHYDEAIDAYSLLIDEFPTGSFAARAAYRIAESHFRRGDYKMAVEAYRGVSDRFPLSPEAGSAKGMADFIEDNVEIDLGPMDFYAAAEECFERGLIDYGLWGRKRILEEYPRSKLVDDVQLGIGDGYARRSEHNQAIVEYQKVKGDLEGEAQKRIGDSYLAMGNYKEAEEQYNRVAKNYPKVALSAKIGLGKVHIAAGKHDLAVKVFEGTLSDLKRIEGDHQSLQGDLMMEVAEALFAGGKFERAIEEYHKVVEGYRGTDLAPRAQFRIGESLVRLRRYKDALEAFRDVERNFPDSEYVDDAQYNIASIYDLYLANYPQAIEEYRRVVDEFPGSNLAPKAQYNIGYIYQYKLEHEEDIFPILKGEER